MNERSSIFSDPLGDVAGFKPKKGEGKRPDAKEIDQVSLPRFRSREPAAPTPAPPVGQQSTKRQPMVYRTGRNTTFSVKTTPETVEAFYEIAREQGWKAGETFERAIAALRRELG